MTVSAVRHVIIHGRVQGVGYRAWVEHMAQRRRLRGWVRNRHDGTVEAVFTGPAAAVTAMIEACRRGPPGARVESVDVRETADSELSTIRTGEEFSVLPTV